MKYAVPVILTGATIIVAITTALAQANGAFSGRASLIPYLIGYGFAALLLVIAAVMAIVTSHRDATAASLSAEALINSERAWVMVDLEWDGRIQEISEVINDILEVRTTITVTCICRNQGKSPAWIAEKCASFGLVRSLDSLPSNPPLDSAQIFQSESEPLAAGTDSRRSVTTVAQGRRDYGVGVIYGAVKYRDAFERDRITTFGYTIDPRAPVPERTLQRMSQHPEYNKNT